MPCSSVSVYKPLLAAASVTGAQMRNGTAAATVASLGAGAGATAIALLCAESSEACCSLELLLL
jgi:hypothetical protein